MQIAETETDTNFPDNAIKIHADNGSGALLRVMDKTGTKVLWEAPETEPESSEPKPVGAPKLFCTPCDRPFQNVGAKMSHDRSKHPSAVISQRKVEVVEEPVLGRELPAPVQQAILGLLGNTDFQTLRRPDDKPLQEFFFGFSSGIQAALAIVCGALSYSTAFLGQEKEDSALKP